MHGSFTVGTGGQLNKVDRKLFGALVIVQVMVYGQMNRANHFTKIVSDNATKFDAKCMMCYYF